MQHLRTFIAGLAVTLVACGSSSNTNAPGGAPGSNTADAHAAQQSAQAGDDAGKSDTFAANATFFGILDDIAEDLQRRSLKTSTVLDSGCTADVTFSIKSTQTVDANVVFTGTCTGKRQIAGDLTIQSTVAANGNRTLNVTEKVTITLADKNTVTITSLDSSRPTMQVNVLGTPANGNVTLTVELNEHRVRSMSDGNVVFDMNITTASGGTLVVDNSYGNGAGSAATERTLKSGTITVHHNRAKFTATHSFTDLARSLTGTCACPESGVLVQNVTADDGAGSYTRTYTFTGCGQATVATTASTLAGTSNGSATVTWNDCQN